ncbi:MAG: 4-(cytidine 5'-diphospho)-2-C-methyl-D-erythritol kinase [Lachnospiraceae bacterium]|nr:4-(cytidine 5'-diphospho)-2-C-methyl-D-erythritol kinase [Lachnospiraceae bacterium]
MESIQLNAMAKINLGLDVLRKREDGYHEVRMIMQTVHIYDKIQLTRKKEPGIFLTSSLRFLPVNEGNLAYRAAQLLMEEFQIKEGLDINLQKNIPVAAGMAGGSTDAAAVLIGVNKLFALGLSDSELMTRGVKLGADVPYCVMGGTALAEGIGEQLTRLPDMPDCYILVVKPAINVSTKFVYENLGVNDLPSEAHADIDGQLQALEQGNLSALCDAMGNILQTVTEPAHPIIGELKTAMKKNGACNAMMSGSGPTVFGLFDREEIAKAAYWEMRKDHPEAQIHLTRPCAGTEWIEQEA